MKTAFICYAFFFYFICSDSSAQVEVYGIVINSLSEPIKGVNVYIANTKIGTSTNDQGVFVFDNLSAGVYEIIISHVSYSKIVHKIEIAGHEQKVELKFLLQKNERKLNNVDIEAQDDKKWRRQYKRFEKEFLGNSIVAAICEVLNPWVVDFQQIQGEIIATAEEPIQLMNRSTGYKVSFFLDFFRIKTDYISYSGKPFFEELIPENDTQMRIWEYNRKAVFSGSIGNFINALLTKQMESEGFHVYKARLDKSNQISVLRQVREANILNEVEGNELRIFDFEYYLKVFYTEAIKPVAFNTSTLEALQQKNDKDQISYLSLEKEIILLPNGQMRNPEDLHERGYWFSKRIAELLPVDIEFNIRDQ